MSKGLSITLKVILFIVGMPLFLAMAVLNYFKINAAAPGYSFWTMIGMIVAGVFSLVFLFVALRTMRKTNKKSIHRQTKTLIAVPCIMMLGLGLLMDVALPEVLDDATSGTLFYEDLVNNYEEQAIINGGKTHEFIRRNVLIGAYDDFDAGKYYSYAYMKNAKVYDEYETEDGEKILGTELETAISALSERDTALYKNIRNDYLLFDGTLSGKNDEEKNRIAYGMTLYSRDFVNKLITEGITNTQTAELISTKFKSIDQDGYVTFDDCLIDYANGPRMTIPVVVHLLLDYRYIKSNGTVDYAVDVLDPLSGEVTETTWRWTVLDMAGGDMVVDATSIAYSLGDMLGMDFRTDATLVSMVLKPVLEALTNALESEDALKARLTLQMVTGTDANGNYTYELYIRPNNLSRGVLGYQDMAWLNSNNLLLAIISLYSLRTFFFIFGAVMAASMYIVGMVRIAERGGKDVDNTKAKKKKAKKGAPTNEVDYTKYNFGEVTLD